MLTDYVNMEQMKNANDTKWIRKETSYIHTLLVSILWFEFSNNFDAKSDFGKIVVTKKSTHLDHSYLKYAL